MEGYDNEDVLIIDDGRSSTFKFSDFLKIIDPHVSTAIQSRYNNKTFVGKMHKQVASAKPYLLSIHYI